MPYIIEVPARLTSLRMPENKCPYCMAPDASDHIITRYQKQLGFIPAPVTPFLYLESNYKFPACKSCAAQVRWLGRVAPYLALVPLAAMLAAVFFDWPQPKIYWWALIAGGVLATLALVVRQWRLQKFRVGYQSTESMLIFSSCEQYAKELAQINHLPMRYRWFVFRWY